MPFPSRALVVTCFVLLAAAPRAFAVEADVHYEGLDGDAEENVQALVELDHQDEKTLTDLQVQRLYDKAPEQIKKGLEPFGWYRPAIAGELVRTKEGGWLATFHVTPGPRVTIAHVAFTTRGEGASDRGLAELVRTFPLHEGDPLLHASYEAGKVAVNEWAARSGYLDGHFVEQHVDVDPAASTANIVLTYDTGPLYRYGDVRFQQDVLKDRLLQGMVDFDKGDVADYRDLLQLQGRLRESTYFTYAEVTAKRDEAQGNLVPVVVTLTPSKKLRYEAGAGYGTDTGPSGRAAVEFRRLNRSGHRARIEGTGSLKEKSGSARYMMPRGHLGTGLITTSAGFQQLNTGTTDSQTLLGGVRLTSTRGAWQKAYALEFRRDKFEVGPDSGTTVLLTPITEWTRMQADDPVDVRHGFKLTASARGGKEGVVSDVSFVQLATHDVGIVRVGGGNRLLGRVDLAWTGVDGFRRLPPAFRFFAGGATSVRGYGYQDLGVVDARTGQVVGGPQLVVGSVEFEHRFLKHWGVATFYDIGNAVNRFGDPLKSGAGVGLRWLSPVGPVRVDAAWALSLDNHPARIHLRIGPDL
jgi:translocation and assembly module TamA